MDICAFTAEDEAAWRALWAGYLKYYKSAVPEQVTATTWARLLDPASGVLGLCAVSPAGEMLGIVHYLFHPVTWSEGPRCYLEDLFTAKAARGQGVGRALIKAVADAARGGGADQLYWMTEDFNTRAHHLYDKVADKTPFIKYKMML